MAFLWDQLALSEPHLKCEKNDILFELYRDKIRLIRLNQFLMALNDDFENVQSLLLHWKPLPSMDTAFSEIL